MKELPDLKSVEMQLMEKTWGDWKKHIPKFITVKLLFINLRSRLEDELKLTPNAVVF